MLTNLEIKVKILDVDDVINVAKSLRAEFKGHLHQIDTYFNVPKGRLKLREINNEESELIYYERPENSDQRLSQFTIYPTTHHLVLKEIISKALGIQAVVEKKRTLFIYDGIRIHIDDVRELGNFLEFEVPVTDSEIESKQKMDFIIKKFHLSGNEFIRKSYLDMIIEYMGKTLKDN